MQEKSKRQKSGLPKIEGKVFDRGERGGNLEAGIICRIIVLSSWTQTSIKMQMAFLVIFPPTQIPQHLPLFSFCNEAKNKSKHQFTFLLNHNLIFSIIPLNKFKEN